jgi:hypothetical protein
VKTENKANEKPSLWQRIKVKAQGLSQFTTEFAKQHPDALKSVVVATAVAVVAGVLLASRKPVLAGISQVSSKFRPAAPKQPELVVDAQKAKLSSFMGKVQEVSEKHPALAKILFKKEKFSSFLGRVQDLTQNHLKKAAVVEKVLDGVKNHPTAAARADKVLGMALNHPKEMAGVIVSGGAGISLLPVSRFNKLALATLGFSGFIGAILKK